MPVASQVYSPHTPIRSVRPHPRNPRRGHPGALSDSILENGFYGAVLVQRSSGFILVGEQRWWAAQRAGLPTIPTLTVDVDDATALRILLGDNRVNDLARYDQRRLAETLTPLAAGGPGALVGTGYDPEVVAKLVGKLAAEDARRLNLSPPTPDPLPLPSSPATRPTPTPPAPAPGPTPPIAPTRNAPAPVPSSPPPTPTPAPPPPPPPVKKPEPETVATLTLDVPDARDAEARGALLKLSHMYRLRAPAAALVWLLARDAARFPRWAEAMRLPALPDPLDMRIPR